MPSDSELNASGHALPNLTPAKRIYVFKNGDVFFAGKETLVNPRYTRTWNSFLDQLNLTFKLNSGAVQRVHTPVHGHVVDDFALLESGSAYVVAGHERFRRMDYNEVRVRNLSPPKSRRQAILREINDAKPVVHSKIQAEAKLNVISQPKTIWIYRNGESFTKPILVLLKPRELATWESLLRALSDKVTLNSALRRIFRINGEEITNVDQLQNNQFYVVAGGYEKFMPVTYGNMPPTLKLVSPRDKAFGDVKYLSHMPTPPKQDSIVIESPKDKAYYDAMRPDRTFRRKPRLTPIDYDQDSSGVFRAKKPHEETRGAKPVQTEEFHQPPRSPSPHQVEDESHDEGDAEQRGRNDRKQQLVKRTSNQSIDKPQRTQKPKDNQKADRAVKNNAAPKKAVAKEKPDKENERPKTRESPAKRQQESRQVQATSDDDKKAKKNTGSTEDAEQVENDAAPATQADDNEAEAGNRNQAEDGNQDNHDGNQNNEEQVGNQNENENEAEAGQNESNDANEPEREPEREAEPEPESDPQNAQQDEQVNDTARNDNEDDQDNNDNNGINDNGNNDGQQNEDKPDK